MKSNSEKIAYLKGLLSGIKLDSADEKKVFDAILEILEGVEEKIEDMDSRIEENSENIDNVDQHLTEVDMDLGSVEELIYGDEDCDCCAEEDDCEEEDFSEEDILPEDAEDEDDSEMYEVECPACHETIYLEESVILDGNVECPNCGEELEFDIEFDD